MTKEEWKTLKCGDIVLISGLLNYWKVLSIGVEDIPIDLYDDCDFVVNVEDITGEMKGHSFHYSRVSKVETTPEFLELLQAALKSEDYITFIQGAKWMASHPSESFVRKMDELIMQWDASLDSNDSDTIVQDYLKEFSARCEYGTIKDDSLYITHLLKFVKKYWNEDERE